jgi:hypothetical protein
MAILNHGSTIRTADGGQSTTTIVTASNIGSYAVASNATYYIGTTQNVFNRASGAQTLTGVSIDGNAANITAYTINQNLGTSNAPSFAGATLSSTLAINGGDGLRVFRGASSTIASHIYWANAANTVAYNWQLDENNNAAMWGYTSAWGKLLTVTSSGAFTASGDVRAPIFYDSNDTTFFIDPANGGFNLRGGTSNRVTFNSGDSGIIVTNAEGISSNVRLGCAWGRPGIYNGSSITVGAETQIDFVIGNVLRAYVDSSSNLFGVSSARAPIFYDSGNTAYYVDPASTSNLVGLTVANTITGSISGNAATASNATQFGGESNTNFLRGLSSGTEANINNYTDNGFRIVSYTGHSKGLLSFTPGGSIGTVQHEYFYGIPTNGWRVRNKTDNTTWSAWGNVVMTDTNQGALTGTVITTGNSSGLSPTFTNLYANVFYDQNDSAYYLDPASTTLSLKTRGYITINNATAPNNLAMLNIGSSGSGETRAIDISGGWSGNENKSITFTHATGSTNIVAQINAQHNGPGSKLRWGKLYHGGDSSTYTMELISESTTSAYLTVAGSVRSPIFYDSGDTNYYLDPAGTSRLNTTRIGNINVGSGTYLNTITPIGDTNINLSAPSGAFYFDTFPRMPGLYDSDNTAYYLDPASTSLLNGTRNNSVVAGSTSAMTSAGPLAIYSASSPYISFHDGGVGRTAYMQETGGRFYFGEVTYTESEGSFRAPLFYDVNDTNYYVDPASSSVLNFVRGTNFYDGTGTYNVNLGSGNTEGRGLVAGYSGGSYGGIGYNVRHTTTGGSWIAPMADTSTYLLFSNGVYFYYAAGGTAGRTLSYSTIGSLTSAGIFTVSGDSRAPIFYDSNNTSYYLDPNSGSNLYDLTLSGAHHVYLTINPGNNYEAMVRYIGGTGSSWYVGKRTSAQLVGTANFHFYSEAAGATVGGIDTSGNIYSIGSVRSPIFYDSDNTGYYIDAASTSNLNILGVAGRAGIGGAGSRSTNGLTVGFTDNSTFAANNDVGDTDRMLSIVNESSTTNAMAVLGFRVNPNGGTANAMLDIKFVQTGATNTSALHYTFNHGGSFADRFSILSSGNVGIGTISPTQVLDVRGNIKLGADSAGNYVYYVKDNEGFIIRTTRTDVTQEGLFRSDGWGNFTFNNNIGVGLSLGTGYGVGSVGTGIVYANGSVRAPIFYDSNNTAYYIDAASTSNLVGLTVANTITGSITGNAGGSSASCTGNAATATILQTARNINGTSFNGSAAITTATWGTARTLTIGATGKSVDGSAGVSWSLAEIGALPLSGGQITGNTTFSADNHLTFGPNSSWGSSIRIGGNGYTATGTETASVVTTDGNLHLDAAKSTNGIYLNWYGGTSGVFFGNGSSGQVAFVSNTGNASFSGVVDATQFRDASNTAYYVDPASTSNLLGLTVTNTITGSITGNAGGSSASCTGNAATATILQTARNINGTSFNGSAAITTATWGTARTLTIGSTGKSVDGSANVSWSLAELGAAATNQTMFIGTTSVAINRSSASQTLTGVSIDGNSATTTLATKATRANGSFYIDDNYGNTVVGLYSATRLQGVFAMGDSYKLTADGTGVGTLYGLAWSHPNFGGVAANLADHGLLILQNGVFKGAWGGGSFRTPSDIRGTLFYDWDNTGYYCDPASTSNLNAITAAGNITAAQYYTGGWFRNNSSGNGLYNETTGQHFYSDSANYWNIASSASAQGIRLRTGGHNGTVRGYFYADTNNHVGILNQDGNWRLRVVGGDYSLADGSSMRAQIFYDSNDTSYYVDPNSGSNLVSITNRENLPGGSGNTYYWSGSAMSFYWTKIANVGGGNTHAAILITYKTDVNYNPFGLALLSVSAFNSQTFSVKLEKLNGDSMQILIRVDNNNDVWLLTAAEWSSYKTWKVISKLGSPTIYYSSLTEQLTTPANSIEIASGQEVRGNQGAATSATVSTVANHLFGGLTVRSDVRAPIFYDSDDTAFYLDPAGTSNLNKFSTLTMSYNDMNSMHVNSPYVNRYNGSSLYRNGTMGYGTVDCNVMFSNWGSGFIDSWSSPANAPGGSTHYVGLQGFHYNHVNNSQAYGFQMLCAGEADNRFFWRSAWPNLRSWVEMIHSGNIGSQTVATAGSCTGNSATVTNGVYTTGDQSIGGAKTFTRINFGATGSTPYSSAAGEGFGNGITFGGDENSGYYRIFTTMENVGGNYSKLALNWHTGIRIGAYPNYGGVRFYNNAFGNGTEIFSVGSLDSNVRVVNTIYAQSFYDINNTAYYIDPNSTSNIVGLTVANTITGSVSGSSASCTGNAATATTLQTARTLTIGSTGKTFNGSANVSWSLAEIGALPLAGGTMTGAISTNVSGTSIFIGNQNVSTSNALRINWHTDADLNYFIGKRGGAWTQPMDIAFYTGIKYHANSTYNAHIFYVGGFDTTEAFSIGKGDNHVRVNNYLYAPLMYDTNDTAFYCNPGGNSIFNTIKTNNVYGGNASVTAASSTTINTAYNLTELTMAAFITTLTFSNIQSSGTVHMWTIVTLGNGSATSVTWPAAIKWPGGTAPNITGTNTKRDIYQFVTYDGGTNIYAIIVGQNL